MLLLESQHAIAIVINAPPAIRAIKIALASVSAVPNNIVTIKKGIIASDSPVTPSIIAVIVSIDFIFFEVYTLVSLSHHKCRCTIINLNITKDKGECWL